MQSQISKTENETEEWNRFIGVAKVGSIHISNCVKALTQVSKCWGKEKVQHYEWYFLGEKYCKKLRAAANQVPAWDEAKIKLNRLIVRRIEMPGRGRGQSNSSRNPVARVDLDNIKSWKDQKPYIRPKDPLKIELPYEELALGQLPDGYVFDKFGLVAHKNFVASNQENEASDQEDEASNKEDDQEMSDHETKRSNGEDDTSDQDDEASNKEDDRESGQKEERSNREDEASNKEDNREASNQENKMSSEKNDQKASNKEDDREVSNQDETTNRKEKASNHDQ